jgi:DNA repair protein RecN (Recombination protein N)
MLIQLNVRDFAIVEAVEVNFDRGLTVVSGETGAGKSLLVDALLLLAGARADSGMVRVGCERAELSAVFDLTALPDVRAWLGERDLDDGDECLLRRVIRSEGASRAWINGRPATAQMLSELTAWLIEIHGQHEHQALLDRHSQLALIDAHGGHASLLADVAGHADRWREIEHRRLSLSRRTGDDGDAIERLRHHLSELQSSALAPDAFHALEQEHRRLAHRGEALEACITARDLLDGDSEMSVLAVLAKVRHLIEKGLAVDPALANLATTLGNADVELHDASTALDAFLDDDDLDPDRLGAVDTQLARLHDLARKHRVPAAELVVQRERIADELATLENAELDLAGLAERRQSAFKDWAVAAEALSAARASVARRLGEDVSALMGELGMAGGQLSIDLPATPSSEPDRLGRERVEFMVSANPGQPLRPLRKVASGGELSRIALAIEVAALGDDPVPTMIFDEVDSGVGGAVAEILGQKLRRLGGHAQVLCVTHLPQVAAQGHHHLHVVKRSSGNQVHTGIAELSGDERIDEIARMLGGVEITQATIAHARQMLGSVNPR